MYFLLKPILFLLPPERAHYFTVSLLKWVLRLPIVNLLFKNAFRFEHPQLQKQVMGLHFQNPIGLAAGFDKDGHYFREMSALGFGFVELGTVTPKPQAGNPKPRLFRLPKDNALINRMGFNNNGVEALVQQLKQKRPQHLVIGGNIGKNKTTPNEQATDDYVFCFNALFPYVDYFVVNVSSPNTPDLRALQEKEPLTKLLSTLQAINQSKANAKPILLKIAPDLSFEQIDDILDIVEQTQLAGIIATNTTIERSGLTTDVKKITKLGSGGLSGAPLKKRSTEIIRYISNKTNKKITIIGVGGIEKPTDTLEKLAAGADLVQVYSGLVYAGPSLIKQTKKLLLQNKNESNNQQEGRFGGNKSIGLREQ